MKKNKKGFTLVELVVVVAVLLILAAIAIPTVSGIISDSQKSADAANAKAIETAIKYAIADNEVHANDSTYSKTSTVSDALEKSGVKIDVISDNYITKQKGAYFAYNSTNDSVIVVSSGSTVSGYASLTTSTAIG